MFGARSVTNVLMAGDYPYGDGRNPVPRLVGAHERTDSERRGGICDDR